MMNVQLMCFPVACILYYDKFIIFCGYYCHRRWKYRFCAIIATAGGYHFCGFLLTPVFWWQYHRPFFDGFTLD